MAGFPGAGSGPIIPSSGDLVARELVEDAMFEETSLGRRAVRAYIVDNLDQNRAWRVWMDAANTPGIPRLYETHPEDSRMVVISRVAAPVAGQNATAKVVVHYEIPQPLAAEPANPGATVAGSQVEVGSVLVDSETEYDVQGKQIIVSHVFHAGVSDPCAGVPAQSGEALAPVMRGAGAIAFTGGDDIRICQPVRVTYRKPQIYVRYSRRELESPGDLASFFVGRVNATPIFGDPPRYWMCTEIRGVSEDSGETYLVEYGFLRNEDFDKSGASRSGWDPPVVLIDPQTGQPPPNLILGQGLQYVRIYKDADFFFMGI
jgi:hypothetical protein